MLAKRQPTFATTSKLEDQHSTRNNFIQNVYI